MKKISFNQIAFSALFLVLISFNIYLCINYRKLFQNAQVKDEQIDLSERKSQYYLATFKQSLDIDSTTPLREAKLGVYLNMLSCDVCSIETLNFLTHNFQRNRICVYIDKRNKDQIAHYDVKGMEVRLVENDRFFLSKDPFFFLQLNGTRILKYTHENEFPETTKIYVEKIKKLMGQEKSKIHQY